jgi:hypothetical protein
VKVKLIRRSLVVAELQVDAVRYEREQHWELSYSPAVFQIRVGDSWKEVDVGYDEFEVEP